MQSAPNVANRKLYDRPVLRRLGSEQATLSLVSHAYIGHRGAKEILEVLFPLPSPTYSESRSPLFRDLRHTI